MKQFLQTSKSSVSDAIKAVGLKDMARTATSAASAAAIQSVFSQNQPPLNAAGFKNIARTAASAASSAAFQTVFPSQTQIPTPQPQIPPEPFLPPPYYPPYYYPSPPPVPREPFYPQTTVGASRVDTIVPGKVAEADLHHVGKHPYPFYKQKWFIVLIIVIVVAIIIGIVIGVILYVRHKDNTDPNVTVPAVPNY